MGGAELGTSRDIPSGPDLHAIARTIEQSAVDGLLIIGGWEAYAGAHTLFDERANFPAFNIPIICLPATIDNNLPGSELSIGADTALNSIVLVVDKIKQAAVAEQRCYVVEVMGRRCGYLAMMSGLATGAERVYLHEDGVTLKGVTAAGIGPLAIGGIKYKVESGLFRKMIEAEKPLFLDFRDAFALARELVA